MPQDPDFSGPPQLGLGFDDEASEVPKVDPAEVRDELLTLLAMARSAHEAAPWDRDTQRFNRVVFPQMACWLPEEEAHQLCLQFAQELDRIEDLIPV